MTVNQLEDGADKGQRLEGGKVTMVPDENALHALEAPAQTINMDLNKFDI